MYDRIDEVMPEKLRAKLQEHEGQARFSKEMATITREAPTKLDLEACRLQNFDRERVEALFHDLEFRSLIARIPDQLGEAQHEAKQTAVGRRAALPYDHGHAPRSTR